MQNVSENFSITWWGCASVEIEMAGIRLAIDPYVYPDKPEFRYIFCTQEHFDHFHRETLLKLCKDEVFRKLIVNVGCVSPAQPIDEVYGAAASASDLPAHFLSEEKLVVLYPKYLKSEGRSFPDPCEVQLGRILVEAVESGEEPSPEIPSNGYLITDTVTGLSLYHTGDIWEPYPAMAELRDRVDFLFHMKMGWNGRWDLLRQFVEYIRPRHFVPIHYRTDSDSYPVKRKYSHDDPIAEKVRRNWIPDVDDANAYIETLREHIGDITTVTPLTAGRPYEILMPEKRVDWKWKLYS